MSAKSRLSQQRLLELQSGNSRDTVQLRRRNSQHLEITEWWQKPYVQSRLKRAYLVLFAIPGYLYVWNLVQTVYPPDIQNVLFPFSYLPLQMGAFWGNFFFFTWLFQNTGRGLRIAIYFSLVLSLKLQHVLITLPLIAVLTGIFIFFELLCAALPKASSTYARPSRAQLNQV